MQIRQEKGNTLMGLIGGGCELGDTRRRKRQGCRKGWPRGSPATPARGGPEGPAVSATSARVPAWH